MRALSKWVMHALSVCMKDKVPSKHAEGTEHTRQELMHALSIWAIGTGVYSMLSIRN